jgi:hypothetical protein
MRGLVTILILAGLVYAAYELNEKYFKPKPAPVAASQPAPEQTASAPVPAPVVEAPVQAAVEPPPALPQVVEAPAPPAEPFKIICQTDVTAYDPNSPVKPLGTFVSGTLVEVTDCPKITGMKNVAFSDPSGNVVRAVCFEKDLKRTAADIVPTASSGPTPVVSKPKPLTYKPRKWAGEPNWRSVYDDPNHKMMTDRDGNQK